MFIKNNKLDDPFIHKNKKPKIGLKSLITVTMYNPILIQLKGLS